MKEKETKHIAAFRNANLRPSESVKCFLEGWIGDMMGKGDKKQHNGMFILTDKRACFYRKGLFGEVLETIPLPKITSIEAKSMMGYRVLALHTSHDALTFKTFEDKSLFDKVYDQLETLRHGDDQAKPVSVPMSAGDPMEQLKKLAELQHEGILTKDEFAAKKSELLSRM